ncbi:hypothetical protein [Streptomyces axinellae]|uniref:Uncharacterized protein n=1 Tax=Streptomyces axinellae TaxID=552788 RepID=A0ABP6CDP4_9ACTN
MFSLFRTARVRTARVRTARVRTARVRTARVRALPPTSAHPPARTTARTAGRAAAALAAVVAVSVTAAGAQPAEAVAQVVSASPAAGSPPAASTPVVTGRHTGPQIHRFLAWFYGDHGPTPRQREQNVSAFLKEKQDQNPGQDVILCAQNVPQDIKVGPVTVAQSAGFGWATVTAYWADGTTSTSTAYVALDSRPIELHDVVCAG